MSSKEERVALQVLQRLLDQRAQGRRGDLELDARLLLELGQQIAQSAMIVLVAGHQDAELGAGVFLGIVAGGPRGHRAQHAAHQRRRDAQRAGLDHLPAGEPALGCRSARGLAGFSRPYRPRAWSLPFFSVASTFGRLDFRYTYHAIMPIGNPERLRTACPGRNGPSRPHPARSGSSGRRPRHRRPGTGR